MHDALIDAILRLWIVLLFLIWTAWIVTRWSRFILLNNRS
jgi:hypothetical protein